MTAGELCVMVRERFQPNPTGWFKSGEVLETQGLLHVRLDSVTADKHGHVLCCFLTFGLGDSLDLVLHRMETAVSNLFALAGEAGVRLVRVHPGDWKGVAVVPDPPRAAPTESKS